MDQEICQENLQEEQVVAQAKDQEAASFVAGTREKEALAHAAGDEREATH